MERMIKYKEELGQSRRFKEEYRLHIYTNAHTQTKGIWRYLRNTGASKTPQDECKAVECIRQRKGTLPVGVLCVWGGGGLVVSAAQP